MDRPGMSAPRVVCAGLFHETHTFVNGTTPLASFEIRRGNEILAARGDASPWGGMLETAAQLGWQVEPLLDVRAVPSAIVEDAVFEQFWSEFRQGATWEESEIDAVFLVLHGAMVTTGRRDAEGELLRRIREELGWRQVPIVAVLDLHANVTALMAQHASALVTYRENPHFDARDTAVRAAHLLHRQLTRREPMKTAWRGTNIVWPPGGTGTASEPMKSLEAMAREAERNEPGVLEVNVAAGFAFADMEDTGVSFAIVHTPECTQPEALLERFANFAWGVRDDGNVWGAPVDEVVARLPDEPPGLIVLAEESDNIGGGAPGDGTGLLRSLLAHQVDSAAVCLADPEAVRALWELAPGSRATLPLGGRGSRYDAGPFTLEVEVIRRTDGRFELEDKNSHLASLAGDRFDMGPSVLVKHRGIFILLTTNRTPPLDLGQWHSVGLKPAELRVVGVKGAIAHRRAYDPIARANYLIDTPGPCRGDLRRLDYQFLRRPIFPLDPETVQPAPGK
jgi:microcystin degradation protein MlrC